MKLDADELIGDKTKLAKEFLKIVFIGFILFNLFYTVPYMMEMLF